MSGTHGISERPENLSIRRSLDRSEHPGTLDEQLSTGLEDTFPASDPVAVSSPTIAGQAPKLQGTDEVLAEQRAARAAFLERCRREARRADAYEQSIALGGLITGAALAIGCGLWLARIKRR